MTISSIIMMILCLGFYFGGFAFVIYKIGKMKNIDD